jgi:hypothetical protein
VKRNLSSSINSKKSAEGEIKKEVNKSDGEQKPDTVTSHHTSRTHASEQVFSDNMKGCKCQDDQKPAPVDMHPDELAQNKQEFY